MGIIQQQQQQQTMKRRLHDIIVAISWADLARNYFGKSSSWIYNKMEGRLINGKPAAFTPDEEQRLKGALCDLADRLRRAADSI